MSEAAVPLPRHDFYQTTEHIIAAIYIKGLNAEGVQDKVDIQLESNQVLIRKPGASSDETERITVGPLFSSIKSSESTARILSTKIELKLVKTSPQPWPTLVTSVADSSTSQPLSSMLGSKKDVFVAEASGSASTSDTATGSSLEDVVGIVGGKAAHVGGPAKINAVKQKKNWDKVVDAELDEGKTDSSDPNAGGDAALQTMFAGIYKDADADTRRAMIKSFTESGGTTLSTDWSKIGQETTPTRPPDGMEAKKY